MQEFIFCLVVLILNLDGVATQIVVLTIRVVLDFDFELEEFVDLLLLYGYEAAVEVIEWHELHRLLPYHVLRVKFDE